MTTYKRTVLVSSATLTIERAPAGLAFLAGICEHNQIDYEVFDLNYFIKIFCGDKVWKELEAISTMMDFAYGNRPDLKAIVDQATDAAVDKVLSYNPDLVALTSLSSMQIAWTDKFLAMLKSKSDVTVIGGGPGISYEQEPGRTAGRILADKGYLDYFVLGEGDWAFDSFLKGKIDLGVNHKADTTDHWVPQLEDLSNTILPTYKKIDLTAYGETTTRLKLPPTINVTGSRGCVRRCTFCDIGHLWKKFRFRSAEHIISEIKRHFEETGCVSYFFNDSLLNGSLKQFIELLEGLAEMRESTPALANLKWAGQFIVRPSKYHPERMYELMQRAGCDHIQVGIESGNEEVREHMGKKFGNDDIDYHFAMCSKYKIRNFIFMFVGYPTETLEKYNETIEFYKKNQKYLIDETIIGTNVNGTAGIYKNTPLDLMRDELGIEIHNTQYSNASNWTSDKNPTLTVKERYRRYIELSKVVTELRYPKGSLNVLFLEMHIADIQNEIKNETLRLKKLNKIINIKEEK